MSGVFQHSALGERVSHFVLQRAEEETNEQHALFYIPTFTTMTDVDDNKKTCGTSLIEVFLL